MSTKWLLDRRIEGFCALQARRIRGDGLRSPVIIYSACLAGDTTSRAKEAGVAACIPRRSGVGTLAREITAITLDLDG